MFPSSVLGGWPDKQHAVTRPDNASSRPGNIQPSKQTQKFALMIYIFIEGDLEMFPSPQQSELLYTQLVELRLSGRCVQKKPRWKSCATVVTFDSDAFKGNIYLVEGVQKCLKIRHNERASLKGCKDLTCFP